METAAMEEAFAQPQVGVREYLQALYRHRWLFIAAFVVIFATSAIRTMTATPIYRSTAKLLVETEKKRGQDVVYETTGITGARKLQTQIEVIRSAAVVARALAKVKLEPASIPMISVEALRDTDLVAINCDAPDNQLAADFANALAEEYVALSLENNQKAAGQGLDFVNEQIERAEAELRDREIELQTFQEQAGPAGIGDAGSGVASRVQTLRDSAHQLKASIAASEASIARLRAEAGRGQTHGASGEAVARNAQIDSLRAELGKLETERATAMVEYAPTSQRVKGIDQQIAKVRAQLTEEMGQFLSNPLGGSLLPQLVQAEVQLLADKERSAAADRLLKQAQAEFDALPGNQRRAAELQRLRAVAEQQYMSLLEAQQQLKLAKESVAAGALIVEPAVPRSTRIAPNRSRSMAIALVFGLFAAIGLVALVTFTSDRVFSTGDLEHLLNLPVLASTPRILPDEPVILESPMGVSAAAEAYRMLRSALDPTALNRRVVTLLVTGAGYEEGKTTIAANVAIAHAESGRRVILVDADLRRARLHEVFELANTVGLTQCISGEAEPAQVLSPTGYANLSVLPSGPLPPNPAELLGSDRALQLLDELRGMADLVVLDSSQALSVPDIRIVSRVCDATVIAVDMDASKRADLKSLCETLAREGTALVGLVLNRNGHR